MFPIHQDTHAVTVGKFVGVLAFAMCTPLGSVRMQTPETTVLVTLVLVVHMHWPILSQKFLKVPRLTDQAVHFILVRFGTSQSTTVDSFMQKWDCLKFRADTKHNTLSDMVNLQLEIHAANREPFSS
mmetsp:Transcript_5603/g.12785  ORF Transcript_5603/g.12785 Transcript_5603/m.12785 type:complete len:127 (+) Transcript_5603:486-866(+)